MRWRLLDATAALGLGAAFCFFTKGQGYGSTHPEHVWPVAIPFAGLALMRAGGVRRSTSAVAWIALAVLNSVAFVAANQSGSLTIQGGILFLQVYYGVMILGHLGSREHSWRLEEAGETLKPNAPAAWTLGILLLACSGIAALLSERAWAYDRWPCNETTSFTDGCPSVATPSGLVFGILLAAAPWLSAAFTVVQLALGRTTKGVALLWFGAAVVGLLLLLLSIGLSAGLTGG